MKEIREEVNKDNQLPRNIGMNPFIFIGLDAGLKQRVRRISSDRATKLDILYGWHRDMIEISGVVEEITGYSISDIRSKAVVDNSSNVGIKYVRQAFCIAAMDIVDNLAAVGRYIDRSRMQVHYSHNTCRERLNIKGYELLNTIYKKIKEKLDANGQKI